VRELIPDATIVALSSEENPAINRAAIEAGAAGFIPKSSTPNVLIAALKLALAGGVYLPPSVLQSLRGQPAAASSARLSPSRSHISQGVSARFSNCRSRGKVNKIIARELKISEATVKAHLSACFRALGVSNRTEAVFAAANMNLKGDGSA
jgi:DNA-binding NarL/FixJ family response regulator